MTRTPEQREGDTARQRRDRLLRRAGLLGPVHAPVPDPDDYADPNSDVRIGP